MTFVFYSMTPKKHQNKLHEYHVIDTDQTDILVGKVSLKV